MRMDYNKNEICLSKNENLENCKYILKSKSDIANKYYNELQIDKHAKTYNMKYSKYSTVYMNIIFIIYIYIYRYEFRYAI